MEMFPPKNQKKKNSEKPKPFVNIILTTVLFFVIIIIFYSIFSVGEKEVKEVTISDVANQVVAGNVKKIEVAGDKLNITFADDTVAFSKKEEGGTLSETLANFGITG